MSKIGIEFFKSVSIYKMNNRFRNISFILNMNTLLKALFPYIYIYI